jgi:segregation and condensation protein B
LKTLLDRGLVRMIGKREEVGRPILYGTTPEFLRTFSLRDLNELPTLREFRELGAAEKAEVDAQAGPTPDGTGGGAPAAAPPRPEPVDIGAFADDEDDGLLADLERASAAAAQAVGPAPEESTAETPPGASDPG